MLPSLSIDKPTLAARSLSRPVSPLAITLATLRKNLQITVRYLPNLLGSLVEISVRALFFLLFSNVISVNSYEMSGVAMTGHNLYIFLLGSLVLFVFTRSTLWGPINAVTNDLYNGTLEYLYSSPGSRYAYYVGVVLSEVVVSLVVFIPLFILLVIISGVNLGSLLLMLLASCFLSVQPRCRTSQNMSGEALLLSCPFNATAILRNCFRAATVAPCRMFVCCSSKMLLASRAFPV